MAYLQARRDFLKLATTGASATVLIPGSLGALGDVALKEKINLSDPFVKCAIAVALWKRVWSMAKRF